ncbi:MAG TPA: hypothetical protein VGR11_12695 [Solirubrobacteraceae bacterium]|nr:hypothetical protein [Solirubrobacteraceae bacterium]
MATTFELGRHVDYDHVLPHRKDRVLMPLAPAAHGARRGPGSGKTVTLNRLAYGVATTSDWQVIVIDRLAGPLRAGQNQRICRCCLSPPVTATPSLDGSRPGTDAYPAWITERRLAAVERIRIHSLPGAGRA